MSVIDTAESPAVSTGEPPAPPRTWSPAKKVVFRFTFTYTALFCLTFAQITFVFLGPAGSLLPESAMLWQMKALAPVMEWLGRNIFGVDAVLNATSGSGDQAAIWIYLFLIGVVAVLVTALWSILDRQRPDYARLWSWTMLLLRLALGGQMLFYGFAKLIPSQMGPPPLAALLEPFGDFSPASVLWLQVGSSPVYEVLLGSVEVVGGLLLFWTRTATLGALVSFVAMVRVFILNMTFDVPVKILSFHLVAFSLILLTPQMRNLMELFVFGRAAKPLTPPALFTRDTLNRWAVGVQVALGIWVAIGAAQISWAGYQEYGAGAPKPELYGIWSVQDFRVDGNPVRPLTTDETRWQRVIFDIGGSTTVQMMNGALVPVTAEIDDETVQIQQPLASLAIDRPDDDTLVLTGDLEGNPTTIVAHRMDHDALTLQSRGFNWVQDEPYFR